MYVCMLPIEALRFDNIGIGFGLGFGLGSFQSRNAKSKGGAGQWNKPTSTEEADAVFFLSLSVLVCVY